MHIKDITTNIKIKPLKYPLKETPHLTIEPNRSCNINCKACYTLNKNYVKSLENVKKEIDIAVKKRKLETITLLGGEPTLHPQITEIIQYVKSKRVKSQLLTNGVRLLKDNNGLFLDELIGAGLDRIILHIDIGQMHVHKDIEEVRNSLFSKLERKKVHFALSLTIYDENQGEISDCLLRYSHYKFFDGILAVIARDPHHEQIYQAELTQEYEKIYHELELEPSAYIPTNLDDEYLSWLFYLYFVNTKNKNTFGVSPGVDRIFRKVYRAIKGHQLFSPYINMRVLKLFLLVTGIMEIISHPKKIRPFFKLIGNSGMGDAIRFHFVVIQTPPEYNEQKNQYQICHSCPDATIRNGMLTPVCIADQINPLNNVVQDSEFQEDLYQIAYQHLGEIEDSIKA